MKQIVFIFMAILLATGMASAQKKAVISAKQPVSILVPSRKQTEKYPIRLKYPIRAICLWSLRVASCGCTTPEWPKEPIAPGKKAQIKVTFDPAGRPGPFTKTISVYSNGKTGSFIMNIRGEVE